MFKNLTWFRHPRYFDFYFIIHEQF
uniref:Uncharacterized protein n=1 Tax=Arundo donax TaxID=35708 RepID=A0A0A9FB52_ARUDO